MVTQRLYDGQSGEQLVVQYLIQHGFIICARNYRRPYGEIDIIARKADLLTFVEVKLRRRAFDNFAAIILPSKQRKIITVAKEYIALHTVQDMICRFDVALVTYESAEPTIDYIEHAFDGD